jgi:membrane-associated phospholipid phosphatase
VYKKQLSLLLFLSFFCFNLKALAQSHAKDTLPVARPKVQWYQTKAFKFAAAPVLLIGLGISEINNNGIYSSYKMRDNLQKNFPGVDTRIDDILPSMPAVLAGGLYISGVKGRNTPLNAAIMFLGANALSSFVGHKLKDWTHIERPDGFDYQSFPSNHTIAAFMAAEFLHQEYAEKSAWISVAGYTMATTVASIRMLENHHWLSDVLAGAGIGILSTKVTYVVYPWLHNMVFKKQQARGFSFSPSYVQGKPGANLSYRF